METIEAVSTHKDDRAAKIDDVDLNNMYASYQDNDSILLNAAGGIFNPENYFERNIFDIDFESDFDGDGAAFSIIEASKSSGIKNIGKGVKKAAEKISKTSGATPEASKAASSILSKESKIDDPLDAQNSQ